MGVEYIHKTLQAIFCCNYIQLLPHKKKARFFQIRKSLSFKDLEKACQTHKMHLTSILSEKENDFLLKYFKGFTFPFFL